jgi:hypothetical protein
MSNIYNATNTFMGLGYTDINIFYFFVILSVVFLIASRIDFSKTNPISKAMFGLLSFVILIGCMFMSANIAAYTIQPQFTEKMDYTTNITSHFYNGSMVDVVPLSSTTISVGMIIFALFAFLNFVEILLGILEIGKDKMEVKAS